MGYGFRKKKPTGSITCCTTPLEAAPLNVRFRVNICLLVACSRAKSIDSVLASASTRPLKLSWRINLCLASCELRLSTGNQAASMTPLALLPFPPSPASSGTLSWFPTRAINASDHSRSARVTWKKLKNRGRASTKSSFGASNFPALGGPSASSVASPASQKARRDTTTSE